MNDDEHGEAAGRTAKYGALPPPVRYADMITTQETTPARDPNGGLDPDWDFRVRHSGG